MELIWIRHLQTPGNEKRQYIGSTDEPLSEKTVEGFLKNPAEYSEVERVICSPMLRCIQTAEVYCMAEIEWYDSISGWGRTERFPQKERGRCD